MEKLATVTLIGGLGCFALAGVASGYLPVAHLSKIPYQKLDSMITAPSPEFLDLSRRYPDAFKRAFGEPTTEAYIAALRLGRNTYIGEACWHCHSQFVRPISNEDIRFGKVSWAAEYMNEMNMPPLFGTRRIGPDLIRESGRHANDWHVAHFYDPTIVAPTSVMPRYTWLYDGEVPNKRGFALIAYVQWLGSWATPEVLRYEERKQANAQ